MSIYSVDVEADGPCPGLYSMVQVGAIKVEPGLQNTFVRDLKAITDHFDPGALKAIGMTRVQTLAFPDPKQMMVEFRDFIEATTVGRPTFLSDNPAFDWQFVNYYFHYYLGSNPFGFSARRIGDWNAGMQLSWRDGGNFRKHRLTKHTHNALDDAKGNAEAFMKINDLHNARITYE